MKDKKFLKYAINKYKIIISYLEKNEISYLHLLLKYFSLNSGLCNFYRKNNQDIFIILLLRKKYKFTNTYFFSTPDLETEKEVIINVLKKRLYLLEEINKKPSIYFFLKRLQDF